MTKNEVIQENIKLKDEIKNLRLIQYNLIQNNESKLVNNIINKIFDKFDLYQISWHIAKTIADYLNTDDCVIYEVIESENCLKQIAANGHKISDSGEIINKLQLKIGEGICGHVAKTGIAEIVNNTLEDHRYVSDINFNMSELTVPIILDGKIIGLIDSEHPNKNHFRPEHLTVIKNISKIIALKIKNAIDLRDKEKFKNKVLKSEQRLASLIQNLDTALLLEDENRKIIFTNEKFCQIFNITVSPTLLTGADCTTAAEESKHLFTNSDEFIARIDDLLTRKEKAVGDELIMVNGLTLERDYIPIFNNQEYQGHLWAYKDTTLQKNYNKNIELQKNKYSNIINNMNLGLIEVDNDDNILMVNKSFLEMSGYEESELIGKKAGEIFLGEKEKLQLFTQNKKREKGISDSYELRVKTKTGIERHWLISGAPNYNLRGEIIGSIGVHLDISDFKLLQSQKEKLLNKIKKSNEELQDYTYAVSHDLKSPLRNINALLSWLKSDNDKILDKTSLEYFNQLDLTIDKMENLINGILHHSSIRESDSDNNDTDIQKLIDELIPSLHIPSNIEVKIIKKLPCVKGDAVKLEQVFLNLINNAVEHMDKPVGFIKIDYIEHPTEYEFSISDNGQGIEEEDFIKIFKMFYSHKAKSNNCGIGLSMVKKILSIYDSKIDLESKLGQGTTFFFKLKKQTIQN
jgi:PAS domain S-box-containing protein